MNERRPSDPTTQPTLRGGDRRGWRFPTVALPQVARRPARTGRSISSAWLRFAGDRPKLAAVRVRS